MTEIEPEFSYTITASIPTPAEYIHLRTITGLSPPPAAAASTGLANSVHCVVARVSSTAQNDSNAIDVPSSHGDQPSSGEAIGMVRLVGDRAVFLLLVDMAVVPVHQGKGVGGRLLDEMLRWVDENAKDAYLTLVGDPPGVRLYKSRGFVETIGLGMARSTWGM